MLKPYHTWVPKIAAILAVTVITTAAQKVTLIATFTTVMPPVSAPKAPSAFSDQIGSLNPSGRM
jgi:ABC-type taurine transport system substrate-binding protein